MERGLFIDPEAVAAGSVIEHFDALCENIAQNLFYPGYHQGRLQKVRADLMVYEMRDACPKITRAVRGIDS